MDIFEKFLIDHKEDIKKNIICRALTCSSYKKVYQQKHSIELNENQTNTELATYGDAVLKLALCELLLDKKENLSEEKKKYESDKVLIEVIAEHYKLLDYINFDKDDTKIPKEYKHNETDTTKYIATTVEAIIGTIYRKNKDLNSICELVDTWIDLIKDNKKTVCFLTKQTVFPLKCNLYLFITNAAYKPFDVFNYFIESFIRQVVILLLFLPIFANVIAVD